MGCPARRKTDPGGADFGGKTFRSRVVAELDPVLVSELVTDELAVVDPDDVIVLLFEREGVVDIVSDALVLAEVDAVLVALVVSVPLCVLVTELLGVVDIVSDCVELLDAVAVEEAVLDLSLIHI